MPDADPLRLAVILGSVRSDRRGIRAARMMMRMLTGRGYQPTLVDPMEFRLPLLDRMYKEFAPGTAPAAMATLATLYRSVDAFVIVSGEYNNGIPPALKNLLDHFLEEYFWRPSGIVCYSAGAFGGVRAAMQLRMTLAELGMPSIPSLLPIPRIQDALTEDGETTDERLPVSAARFIDELAWYARALRRERAVSGTPY
jgi:NAD(P)H-dependent FMN reductase